MLLVLVMALSLAACGTTNSESTTPPTNEQVQNNETQAQTEAQTEPKPETITIQALNGNNLGETVGEVDKATHGEDASWETIIDLNPEYIFVLDRSTGGVQALDTMLADLEGALLG